jgi:hypothetical protein
MRLRLAAPGRGFATAVLALVCALAYPASAQPKAKPAAAARAADKPADGRGPSAAVSAPASGRGSIDKKSKEKNFDFENLKLNGQLRTPQLLYFLERANEELERASLEKRSFIPHMVRSVEEEAL